jgi:hypothetical protein
MPTERPPHVGEVVPTVADRGCCVISATDYPGVSLGFHDRSRYNFFQVAPLANNKFEIICNEPVVAPFVLLFGNT